MYKDYISWIDLLLVPAYFVVLYAIMVYIKKRHPNDILYQKYFLKGFTFKIACTILYCLLIYFYWGFGDSINYFKNVLLVKQLIKEGTESFGILLQKSTYLKDNYSASGTSTDGGWFVERIALILSYFTFSRFIVTSMLFATLAYAGMFKMLQTFAAEMPEWHKKLAFAVLFFPTLSIYGSGILKDTLCITSMGWLVYCSNELFVKKRFRIRYIVILVLCFSIIYFVKAYIIAAFMVPYVIYLIAGLVKRIQSKFFRHVFFPLLLALLVVGYIINAQKIDNLLGSYAIEKLFDTVKEQQQSYLTAEDAEAGSVFNIGTIEPTLSGFLKKMPAGIVAALYRPFLWESRNFLMIFTAMESFLLLFVTLFVLWKTGFAFFIKTIFRDRFVFLCIFYALIFAALVGLSTSNFGTLARYRIPIIPFYLAGIVGIWYRFYVKGRKKPHESTG